MVEDNKVFELGEIVQTKKQHPCGCDRWKIIRVGMDFKIKCLKCERVVMLPRKKFVQSVKKTIPVVDDSISSPTM